MVRRFLAAARRLDRWLHARLGRPYSVLLSIGLVIEIGRRIAEAPERLGELHRLAAILFFLALNVGLLIHQLGELAERAEARGRD